MGPCKQARYSKQLASGVLITIASPWGDPVFRALAHGHAREVWHDKQLAEDFAGRLAAEDEAGRLVPILALKEADGVAQVIGYNVLGYVSNPLTSEPMLGDWGLYVAPEHRRDGIALELLEAQKSVATQLGVRECYAGYVSCEAVGLHRLYEAAGFRKAMIGFSWRP